MTFTVLGSDQDADALPDDWELAHLGGLRYDGMADPDDDGANNRAEYIAGTEPLDPESRFAIQSLQPTHRGWVLQFPASTNRLFDVLHRDDLSEGDWLVSTKSLPGTGGVMELLDAPNDFDTRSYMIRARTH